MKKEHALLTEFVPTHSLEEGLDESSVAVVVAARREQLEPPRIVSERAEAEQVLEEHHPMPPALGITSEKSSSQHDAERQYRTSGDAGAPGRVEIVERARRDASVGERDRHTRIA